MNDARQILSRTVVALSVRTVTIDDYSSVRFVHGSTFRAMLGPQHEEAQKEAFLEHIYRPEYVDELQLEDLAGAWLDGELIGTSGWTPADDRGRCARITSLFVRPLFSRLGIGTRLLKDAEERARRAGFHEYSMRATHSAVPFLERLGYEVTSHGVQPFGRAEFAVAFLRKRRRPELVLTGPPPPSMAEPSVASGGAMSAAHR